MFCKDNFLIQVPGAEMMLESKNHISMQQKASIMKMGRRLESWLILQIRGKLPIEEEFANCQAEKFAFMTLLWISSAATAVRNNREGSGLAGHWEIMGQLMWGLTRKNRDCCLNCEPARVFGFYKTERDSDEKLHDNCFGRRLFVLSRQFS